MQKVPAALFGRCSRPQRRWKENGELALDERFRAFVPPWTATAFEETPLLDLLSKANLLNPLWLEHLKVESKLGREFVSISDQLHKELEESLCRDHLLEARRFDTLSILLQAFPDDHSEILWQEVQLHMREDVEKTCLPLLQVVNLDDVRAYVAQRPP
jgi:hypothetical protein